jgi:hypothetical protein
MMLRVWGATELRPTMDIDLLGRTRNDEDMLVSQFRSVLASAVEPDGLAFDAETLHAEKIRVDADYEGIRVRFSGQLDTARINMQIDIGFGDTVHPAPEETALPTMLAFPAPVVLCYNRETVIAEKVEAMITLGELNSRMKDFYDVWLLSRQFDFDGSTLQQSLRGTFQQRNTKVPASLKPLFDVLLGPKQVQWAAFRGRLQQPLVPVSAVVSGIPHFYLGWGGMVKATITGGVLAAIYLITGSLWVPMALHAGFDLGSRLADQRMHKCALLRIFGRQGKRNEEWWVHSPNQYHISEGMLQWTIRCMKSLKAIRSAMERKSKSCNFARFRGRRTSALRTICTSQPTAACD